MNVQTRNWPEFFEDKQIVFYAGGIVVGGVFACFLPMGLFASLAIKIILPILLFVTFLQIPVSAILKGFRKTQFITALLVGNFIFVPVFVVLVVGLSEFSFSQMYPHIYGDWKLTGFVLLMASIPLCAPCVDYVVSFCRVAKGDAASLTAALPVLLFVQFVIFMCSMFLTNLGDHSVSDGYGTSLKFLFDILPIMILPISCASLLQLGSKRNKTIHHATDLMKHSVVLVTALTLMFIASYAVSEILEKLHIRYYFFEDIFFSGNGSAYIAEEDLNTLSQKQKSNNELASFYAYLNIAFFYAFYACSAPFIGMLTAKIFKLAQPQAIAVIFSLSTRNSLVILPWLLFMFSKSVEGQIAVVILTQTCIELIAEIFYVKLIPRYVKKHFGCQETELER